MGQLNSITHLLLNNNEPGLGNRYEGGSWGRDEHPHAERCIPTELGDAKALQVLELSNNSFGGTPPAVATALWNAATTVGFFTIVSWRMDQRF